MGDGEVLSGNMYPSPQAVGYHTTTTKEDNCQETACSSKTKQDDSKLDQILQTQLEQRLDLERPTSQFRR